MAARVESGRRWVEVWADGRWVPCDPLEVDSWDRRTAEVAAAYEVPAHVRAEFREDDSLLTSAEAGRHFLLARFRNGRFEPDYDSDYPARDGVLSMNVEPGPWWLFAGVRDAATGEPSILARPWQAVSGDSTSMTIDLGPRAFAAAVRAGDRGAGSATTGCAGTAAAWAETVSRLGERYDPQPPSPLFVWDEIGEPSRRVSDALVESLPRELDLRVASIRVTAARGERAARTAHPLETTDLPGLDLARAEAEDRFARDPRPDLPYLLLLDAEGRPCLCLSGLRLDAPDAIRRALRDASSRDADARR